MNIVDQYCEWHRVIVSLPVDGYVMGWPSVGHFLGPEGRGKLEVAFRFATVEEAEEEGSIPDIFFGAPYLYTMEEAKLVSIEAVQQLLFETMGDSVVLEALEKLEQEGVLYA
jgi:hypothetical protein